MDKRFTGTEFDVKISDEHIESGNSACIIACPIALAVKAQAPPHLEIYLGSLEVKQNAITFTNNNFKYNLFDSVCQVFHFTMEDKVSKWVEKFDTFPSLSKQGKLRFFINKSEALYEKSDGAIISNLGTVSIVE